MPPLTNPKPIQTRAYGHFFRSRLEARWAVFFTRMGLKWEYEPEGFDVNGELYLPDFRVWTPQGKPIWREIKPSHIAKDEKFLRFAAAFAWIPTQEKDCDGLDMLEKGPRTELLSGSPREFWAEHLICPRCGSWLPLGSAEIVSPSRIQFDCFDCDCETPGGRSNTPDTGIKGILCFPECGQIEVDLEEWAEVRSCMKTAIGAASSARFEHGEAPI